MITPDVNTSTDKANAPESTERLSELDVEAIEMFINFLRLIGLPKSVGEIYGLLFVSPIPLPMDELMMRLNISSGATSQGLRLLRTLGAVKVVYSPGDRRDHYLADLEISKFATVFIKEELLPRMERAKERLERMEQLCEAMPADKREITLHRISKLRHWVDKGHLLLPVITKLLIN